MINISVQRTIAIACPDSPLTSGSVGLVAQFDFSSDWDGLTKTAVFETSAFYKETAEIGADNSVEIPAAVMAQDGVTLYIGVYGENAGGDLVVPTIYANCGEIQMGANDTPGGAPVTPSQAEQLQGQINDLENRVDDLESGGGGGAGWKTVVDYTLTDGATEIIVDADADGNPFSLAFASIGVFFPANAENATANVVFWLYFDTASDNTIRYIGNLASTQTLNRHFTGCVTAYGNGIKSLLAKDATVFGDIGVCNEEYFSHMRIYCKTEGCFFPAGTRVLVAGIPADGGADA